MAFVEGSLRGLYIKIEGTYVLIGCLTSNSITESSEQISTTTRENGGWATAEVTNQNYSIPFSGIQRTDSALSYTELKDLKRSRELIEWKLEATAAGLEDYGKGRIISLSETADAGSLLGFDGEILGHGAPIKIVAAEPPDPPNAPVLEPAILLGTGDVIGAVILNWNVPSSELPIERYELRISGPGGSERIEVIEVGTNYVDSGVNQGSQYAYNVRAVDTLDNVSAWSNKRLVTIPIPTNVPDQTTGFIYQDASEILIQTGAALITQ